MPPLSSLELSSDKITFKKAELAAHAGGATFTLVVRNTSPELVAVKLKTTAPGTFVVKNNNFVLQPGRNRKVDIALAHLKEADAEPLITRLRQKFLVIAAIVQSDQVLTSAEWNRIDPAQIQSQKLFLFEAVLPERILTVTAFWDKDDEMTVKATLLSGLEADVLVLHPAATLGQVRQSLEIRLSTDFKYNLVTAAGEILHEAADDTCFAHLMQLGITESFNDDNSAPSPMVLSPLDTLPARIGPSPKSDVAKRATWCIAVLLPLLLCVFFTNQVKCTLGLVQ